MEPVIPQEIYWLIPAIVAMMEFIKAPLLNILITLIPKLQESGATMIIKVLNFALAIGGCFLFMEGESKEILQYGILVGLCSTGLYEYAKPVGKSITTITKRKDSL